MQRPALLSLLLLGACADPQRSTAGNETSTPPVTHDDGEHAAGGCSEIDAAGALDAVQSVRLFALRESVSVVTATLESIEERDGQIFGTFVVDEVGRGWPFLAGLRVTTNVERGAVQGAALPSRWLLGLGDARAFPWDGTGSLWMGSVVAIVPAAESPRFASISGFLPRTPHVAVVKIVSQDEDRTEFEVVEALRGTFPARFSDNWPASWHLPWPAVSGTTYIASVDGLQPYQAAGLWLGSITDLRVATEASVAEVRAAIAAPAPADDVDTLRATRETLRTSFGFHRAPFVVSSVVSGRAEECCTNAGGTYVAHDVDETLRGDGAPSSFVLGGHAFYGDEECGDGFLVGLEAFAAGLPDGERFDCVSGAGTNAWPAYNNSITSQSSVRVPLTEQNLADVRHWIAEPPPDFLLRGDDDNAPARRPAEHGTWNRVMSAADAFSVATPIIFTIDDVDEASGATTVHITTTLSLYEYDHIPRCHFTVRMACADARLKQPGAKWVGALVSLDEEARDAYLIPGAFVPPHEMTAQLANLLQQRLNR